MIINDNGREYDTEKIEEYSSYTRNLIFRLIYLRYVSIRDLLSDSCCNKMRLDAVKKAVLEEKNIKRIQNVFNYSVDEINFYISFAEEKIPMAR
ncbi:hypothetical protein [Enterococcus nangangensis]|uniref:hypothetical protein n=1 Tax=Enterococcus nangangensis TaxID=2559926 RepID=UPI0010F5CB0C|nr:hypothetical protein [Enterococcus nangangensis]